MRHAGQLAATRRPDTMRCRDAPSSGRPRGRMEEFAIRLRVRRLLESGEVPCDEPGKTWAGRGSGTHCAACGEPIRATEIEFEAELPSGVLLRLHRTCHAVWREECAALMT